MRPNPRRTRLIALLTGFATTTAGLVAGVALASPAAADNVVTPGNFTGYGFDQCVAPTQRSMTKWLNHSPFLSAGIYISGKSRACRSQPNLTPAWISKQLATGWRLLPITLGPQASCQPRFPRYSDDVRINPKPGSRGKYGRARKQGRAEAVDAVGAAGRLGISPGSTLWYDLEGFDDGNTHCRESALRFLSAWTTGVHALGYVSGVYSSASSGIKMLDDARVNRPGRFNLPDQIWVARWDGAANTTTSYLRSDGWSGARVKQYQGGHNETWGGVTINIDRNYLDLGQGSVARPESLCGGARVDFKRYQALTPGTRYPRRITALKCLLSENGSYRGNLNGTYGKGLAKAVNAWQSAHGFAVSSTWSTPNWVALHAAGDRPVLKIGSAGSPVRRVQRALNAAGGGRLTVSGSFDKETDAALRTWQRSVGTKVTGVAARPTWKRLSKGRS